MLLDESEDDSEDESGPEEDKYGHLLEFRMDPDAMQGIESDLLDSNGNADNIPADRLAENLEENFNFLKESETMPTRVLDDAFHFMDRLLRLLSKKHSAFKAFAHDFSKVIFIRDKSDLLAVQAVLELHGISWEYAKRAKADALN
ncbi:hypothetical protein B0H13DRAFT_2360691 [Mycena leptocephala]|nr:hypothetical protein B0H13DRAFT_2360691 [Mycena leptocephala]